MMEIDGLFGGFSNSTQYIAGQARARQEGFNSAKEQLSHQTEQRIAFFEDKLARYALLLKTLMLACERSGVFTHDDLLKLRETIDAEDGVVDGKLTEDKAPRSCAQCRRKNSFRAEKCMWCGNALAKSDIL
ncbi:MAG: hypothetical protein HUU29_14665 [Planctomycetaceae bacterium]|nr:hypothetical protein [Planctomycetaceae bacterium]